MKQWCHYEVLIRGIGGFWMPDDHPGHQERYESRNEATERADYLYTEKREPEVEVHQKTDAVIYRRPSERGNNERTA